MRGSDWARRERFGQGSGSAIVPPASEMFDWNDQDQVGDTIWAEFSGNEDHIVPYPKGMEDNTLILFGEHDKNKGNEDTSKIMGFNNHTSGDKNDFQRCNVANQSAFQTNEELSTSRLDMEPWPDLPFLTSALGGDYNTGSDRETMATAYMDGFSATNLEEVGVQLDGEPEVFGKDHDKSNSFLDCDWGNIGDFDDFDRIFSNGGSIFCDEMVGNGEFISTVSDVISSTMLSIPMHESQLNRHQSSDHGSSSIKLNELSGGRNKPEDKGDTKKRPVKSRKKAAEKDRNKGTHNLISALPHNINGGQHSNSSIHAFAKAPLQTFHTPGVCQHIHVGNVQSIGLPGHSNQFVYSGHGYSAYSIPATLLMPDVQAETNQPKPAATNCKAFKGSPKHTISLDNLPDVPLRPLMMTPQEKIEKLRRRQQRQAMLAIQQQQQQFGGVSSTDTLVPQACSPRKQNPDSLASPAVEDAANKALQSESKVPAAQNESRNISVLGDDPYLQESIYHQLQDALGKLDIRVRLCIRDSLLRLAQSAMERHSAGDRSGTDKSSRDEDEISENDNSNGRTRCTKLGEAETDTNLPDRIVAHLIFHSPSNKFVTPIKEESPPSTVSFDPDSKASLNTQGSASEENLGMGEMEIQTSL